MLGVDYLERDYKRNLEFLSDSLCLFWLWWFFIVLQSLVNLCRHGCLKIFLFLLHRYRLLSVSLKKIRHLIFAVIELNFSPFKEMNDVLLPKELQN